MGSKKTTEKQDTRVHSESLGSLALAVSFPEACEIARGIYETEAETMRTESEETGIPSDWQFWLRCAADCGRASAVYEAAKGRAVAELRAIGQRMAPFADALATGQYWENLGI